MVHRVEIAYRNPCRGNPRAVWTAQELGSTFGAKIAALTPRPSMGGAFEVRADGRLLWSRTAESRFQDIAELERRIRDWVGHADRAAER